MQGVFEAQSPSLGHPVCSFLSQLPCEGRIVCGTTSDSDLINSSGVQCRRFCLLGIEKHLWALHFSMTKPALGKLEC